MRRERDGEAAAVADLNDLLQLDHDAVEAYTVAIDLARGAEVRDRLVEFRADHKRHIEELAALIRDRGGLPLEMPHATGPLKLAVQALGAVASDTTLLLAFKAVEGQVRDRYGQAARSDLPAEAVAVVGRAADDERRHYDWVEEELRRRGAGRGTPPHDVARVVEGLHKTIADPLERAQRAVAEAVGGAVGTTRSRGGSEAPSPRDVAAGMAARASDADDRVDEPADRSPIVGLRDRDARDEARGA